MDNRNTIYERVHNKFNKKPHRNPFTISDRKNTLFIKYNKNNNENNLYRKKRYNSSVEDNLTLDDIVRESLLKRKEEYKTFINANTDNDYYDSFLNDKYISRPNTDDDEYYSILRDEVYDYKYRDKNILFYDTTNKEYLLLKSDDIVILDKFFNETNTTILYNNMEDHDFPYVISENISEKKSSKPKIVILLPISYRNNKYKENNQNNELLTNIIKDLTTSNNTEKLKRRSKLSNLITQSPDYKVKVYYYYQSYLYVDKQSIFLDFKTLSTDEVRNMLRNIES